MTTEEHPQANEHQEIVFLEDQPSIEKMPDDEFNRRYCNFSTLLVRSGDLVVVAGMTSGDPKRFNEIAREKLEITDLRGYHIEPGPREPDERNLPNDLNARYSKSKWVVKPSKGGGIHER